MDNEEINVDNIVNEAATADDMLTDEVIEEQTESAESLDSITEEEGKPETAGNEQDGAQGASEPGWFKSRWDKNVGKLTAQIREQVRQEYESQIAPLKERMLEMDAQELVKKGEVKSIELAKELLRYRQGQPAPQAQPKAAAEQPRQADGRFAPKQNAVQEAEINILARQAEKIKAKTGIDVIDIMNSDPDIRNKIVSGEMDFYDVAEQAKGQRRKPPAPARSSNGASGQSPNAIDSMSKEQFARLEKKISEGARFSLK